MIGDDPRWAASLELWRETGSPRTIRVKPADLRSIVYIICNASVLRVFLLELSQDD